MLQRECAAPPFIQGPDAIQYNVTRYLSASPSIHAPSFRRITISRQIYGDLSKLKQSHIKNLEKLYKRKVPASDIVSNDFATQLTFLSEELHRVVAVLVDRKGRVEAVMVGDTQRVYLPDIGRGRVGGGRFRGIRLIRSTFELEGRQAMIASDDLSDLSQLQLDMVVTIHVGPGGYPGPTSWAHLVPDNPDESIWQKEHANHPSEVNVDFLLLIAELEGEFQRKSTGLISTGQTPAMLVHVALPKGRSTEREFAEMYELARTASVRIVDTVQQQRKTPHPKYAVGFGKLEDLTQRALQLGVELLIFTSELSPGQLRSLSVETDMKVLDRTQLILDIFAQHAKSKDGKIQVELAQLKYNLPRLSDKHTGMSRLSGGIGGRGPGETKLEINRRRARDRIHQLEKQINQISKQRELRRQNRSNNDAPILNIVGYTNAGKSTLLNTLTSSSVLSENKLFATLRPTSRKLVMPTTLTPIILTDTVGFIHDLPEELILAFKATLEELHYADVLIHVVDASDEAFEEHIGAVERILYDMGIAQKKRIIVFNKIDQLPKDKGMLMARKYGGVALSALDKSTFTTLYQHIERAMAAPVQEHPPTPEQKS